MMRLLPPLPVTLPKFALFIAPSASKVGEVEDVGGLAAKLELEVFEDAKRTEEGSIDVPIAGIVELRGTDVAKQVQRTEPGQPVVPGTQ